MSKPNFWHPIAERLTEKGWSWRHVTLRPRAKKNLHVVEAHNDEGVTHAAVATSVGPAFVALEQSIQSAGE